jgi:hypothetical protein
MLRTNTNDTVEATHAPREMPRQTLGSRERRLALTTTTEAMVPTSTPTPIPKAPASGAENRPASWMTAPREAAERPIATSVIMAFAVYG